MTVEQAGVDLIAKNFRKYLKILDEINKRHKGAFDVDASEVRKAFAAATQAAKKYEKALKEAAEAAKKAQRNQNSLTTALKGFFTIQAAQQIGQITIESAKLSATFDAQKTGLNNLAASFGQSGDAIQAAIQGASKGTVSGLQAILAANRGLLLDVARTPAEFAKVTESAVVLGRTMGLTAPAAIEKFTIALGRKSFPILDDFGIKAGQVNAQMEELAQVQFGVAFKDLDQAGKDSLFIAGSLAVAEDRLKAIGTDAGEAVEAFERLNAQAEDLQVTFGEAVRPAVADTAGILSDMIVTLQQIIALSAGLGAGLRAVRESFRLPEQERVFAEALPGGVGFGIGKAIFEELTGGKTSKAFGEAAEEAKTAFEERFKDVAGTIAGVTFPGDEIEATNEQLEETAEVVEKNEEAINALNQATQRAEQLQLSFGRAAEDAARKNARALSKLNEKQTKDREKLLKDQAKAFDQFEKDRQKAVADAESEIAKERARAAQKRISDQRQLQQKLKQAQDRFNLSQIQSERRFQLSDRRLRAEGDILALQELRENQELARLEEKENFDLSQGETKDDAQAQQRAQKEDLDTRLRELQQNLKDQQAELERQRAETLAGFDQQLVDQQAAQAEQRNQLLSGFTEQEEDRRISQQRQFEDLGRSLADQQGITQEGVTAIAGEFETVFGRDGVADAVMTGFTSRTESEFKTLFERLEQIVAGANLGVSSTSRLGQPTATGSRFSVPEFQEGGIMPGVEGGPPQLAMVHPAEQIFTPAQMRTQEIAAPIIASQTLNVEMSGGFDIRGAAQAGEATVRAAVEEIMSILEVATRRLTRRG